MGGRTVSAGAECLSCPMQTHCQTAPNRAALILQDLGVVRTGHSGHPIRKSVDSSKCHRASTLDCCRDAFGPIYAVRVQLSVYSVRVGRSHSSALEELTAGYLRRFSGSWKADSRVFRSEMALLGQWDADRRGGAAALWLLDSRGKAFASEALATLLGELRDRGTRHLIAAIGPADGWSPGTLESVGRSERLLSLGPMTLPHELARLVLAEQLYRATTILAGHPYHLGHE